MLSYILFVTVDNKICYESCITASILDKNNIETQLHCPKEGESEWQLIKEEKIVGDLE